MDRMCPTKPAVFLELQLIGRAFLVFRRCVIPPLTLLASERDYVSHGTLRSTSSLACEESRSDKLLDDL